MENWEQLKDQNNEFFQSKVKSYLKSLTKELLKKKPDDVLEFIKNWSENKQVSRK